MTIFGFTAAHCFSEKGIQTQQEPENVLALLGRFNMSDRNERGSKKSSVCEIVVHPEWNYEDEKYDADIAVVVLAEQVEFSNQVQTVCLPKATNNDPVGRGTVVGWGKSTVEADNDETPNKLVMPVVNAFYCYTKFPKLALHSSHRAFCAGFFNEKRGSCSGDSGGGFYIADPIDYSWKIHGIVSSSLWGGEYDCDVNSFAIHTNVGLFRDWIVKEARRTTIVQWEIVEVQCTEEKVFG